MSCNNNTTAKKQNVQHQLKYWTLSIFHTVTELNTFTATTRLSLAEKSQPTAIAHYHSISCYTQW